VYWQYTISVAISGLKSPVPTQKKYLFPCLRRHFGVPNEKDEVDEKNEKGSSQLIVISGMKNICQEIYMTLIIIIIIIIIIYTKEIFVNWATTNITPKTTTKTKH